MSKRIKPLNVFKPKQRQVSQATPIVDIIDLSDEGKGVARLGNKGKTVFVNKALPGEKVKIKYTSSKKQYDEADVITVINASSDRVTAECEYYGVCGGCDLQHLRYDKQLLTKSGHLKRLFKPLEDNQQQEVEWGEPIHSAENHYRHRVRFTIKANKNGFYIGFKKAGSHELVDINSCIIAQQEINEALPVIRTMLTGLKNRSSLLECVVSIDSQSNLLLWLISKNELDEHDYAKLESFSLTNQIAVQLNLQSNLYGPAVISVGHQFFNYDVPQNIRLRYQPADFTQVNPAVNSALINQALQWLQLSQRDQVLDFFCGIGNLTLPMAKKVGHIVGYELVAEMVAKAEINARDNKVENVDYQKIDLFTDRVKLLDGYNKIVLDPPRAGAAALCSRPLPGEIKTLLYISCNPSTLIRDAGLLQEQGFKVVRVSMLDMFPHTKHMEAMMLMERVA